MLDDPTFSRALRVEYGALLVGIVRKFRKYLLINKFGKERTAETFADNLSYNPKKLIRGLNNKISKRSKKQIMMVIRHQIIHGARLANKQLKITPTPRYLGKFVNIGTLRELGRINVGLVTSVQQRYLDRLKLLIARVIGGGTLTWAAFVKGIKKLGVRTDKEAEQIARTEVIRTVTAGQADTFRAKGIKRWRWITQRDEKVCPICRPIHGKCVKIGDPFTHDKNGPITKPPAHPNCRCGVEPCV